MSGYVEVPKLSWEYVGEELAVFWESPYGYGREKIASFWWPKHPPESTKEVESFFEFIASRIIESYCNCGADRTGPSAEDHKDWCNDRR